MTWNPAVSGPSIDPHNAPYTTGNIEPPGAPYQGVVGGWNPADPHPDPHDTPMSMSDGLGGGMLTGPVPSNITGGPLSDDRTVNTTGGDR